MLTVRAKIDRTPEGVLVVHTHWTGEPLDRRDGLGFQIGTSNPRNFALATRLVAAINAQRVFTNPRADVDVYGKTYVIAERCVYGRRMNADLRRIGF